MGQNEYSNENSIVDDLHELATEQIEEGLYDEAVETTEKSLKVQPTNAYTYTLKAYAHLGMDEYRKALKATRKAIKLEPDNAYNHSLHAVALVNTKKYRKAHKFARKGIELDPHLATAHEAESRIFIQQKKWEKAEVFARQALDIDPDNFDAINWYIMARLSLNKDAEVGDQIEQSLLDSPRKPYTYANKGWVLLLEDRRDEAMLCFREALEWDRNNWWARKGIIRSFHALNFVYRPALSILLRISSISYRTVKWVSLPLLLLNVAVPAFGTVLVYLLVFSKWVSFSLFNLVLLTHPTGKLALSPFQKKTCSFIAVLIAVFIGCCYKINTEGFTDPIAQFAMLNFMNILPVSVIEQSFASITRTLIIVYTVLLLTLSTAFIFYSGVISLSILIGYILFYCFFLFIYSILFKLRFG